MIELEGRVGGGKHKLDYACDLPYPELSATSDRLEKSNGEPWSLESWSHGAGDDYYASHFPTSLQCLQC